MSICNEIAMKEKNEYNDWKKKLEDDILKEEGFEPEEEVIDADAEDAPTPPPPMSDNRWLHSWQHRIWTTAAILVLIACVVLGFIYIFR